MTPELWALLIANVVSFLAALTALIKSKITDKDRASVGERRDKAESELRDMVLKHEFAITQLKDSQQLTAVVVDDLRDTCAQLNTSIAKLDVNVENLTSVVKDWKK